MPDEKSPKRKRTRNRDQEYARARQRREEEAARRALAEPVDEESEQEKIVVQLAMLAKRTSDMPTDTDRDIDWAYRFSGNPGMTPLLAPSLGAWQWYEYAKANPDKFLEVCAKREDNKAKQSGSLNAQRIEDDKRQQFAILDRIEKHLQMEIESVIKDLMTKFPDDTLNECRKYGEAWKSYFERFPQ